MPMRLLIPTLLIASLSACHSGGSDEQVYVSDRGDVKFTSPRNVQSTTEFNGRALMQSGWRVVWSGQEVGPGQGIVRLTLPARSDDGSAASEIVQIGSSDDPRVVESCKTYGLNTASGQRLPDITINGRLWAAYRASDAGMSQSITATNYRLVHDQVCYALERISYASRAAGAQSGALSDDEAAKVMNEVLKSIEISDRK